MNNATMAMIKHVQAIARHKEGKSFCVGKEWQLMWNVLALLQNPITLVYDILKWITNHCGMHKYARGPNIQGRGLKNNGEQ
jgi:hypothetical protein